LGSVHWLRIPAVAAHEAGCGEDLRPALTRDRTCGGSPLRRRTGCHEGPTVRSSRRGRCGLAVSEGSPL
jgi:hypothetical protein